VNVAGHRQLNRALAYYRRGVGLFVAFGSAPPVTQAETIPVEELLAQLAEVHKMALERLSNDTDPAYAVALRKAGPREVNAALLGELADMYGLTVDDLANTIALAQISSPESLGLYSIEQPRRAGALDGPVLEQEALDVLVQHGASEGPAGIHFAQCGDPRFPPQLALMRVTPVGVSWCSLLRPHSFDEVLFTNTKVIWHDGPYWRFKMDTWRPRRFRPYEQLDLTGDEPAVRTSPLAKGDDDRWAPMMDAIREYSSAAGLLWKNSWEGSRR
jgi:hypothetical protein